MSENNALVFSYSITHIGSQDGVKRVSRLSIKPLLDSPTSPDQVVGEVKSTSEQNAKHYELPIQNQNV